MSALVGARSRRDARRMSISAPLRSTIVPQTPEAVVTARDVVRRYGDGDTAVHALRGVSLDIAKGRLTAIMGPSGSGKSTLMHLMAALDRPTSGQVVIDGTLVTGMKDKALTRLRRDRLGFVFQSFNLVPTLTAKENITLPLDIAGTDVDQEWFETVIKTVGLADRLKHRPNQLSGGQQQRVACARALVSRPTIVFADEPTGNLDTRSGAEIVGLLRELNAEGATIVVITHDRDVAAAMPRRVEVRDGEVVADG